MKIQLQKIYEDNLKNLTSLNHKYTHTYIYYTLVYNERLNGTKIANLRKIQKVEMNKRANV